MSNMRHDEIDCRHFCRRTVSPKKKIRTEMKNIGAEKASWWKSDKRHVAWNQNQNSRLLSTEPDQSSSGLFVWASCFPPKPVVPFPSTYSSWVLVFYCISIKPIDFHPQFSLFLSHLDVIDRSNKDWWQHQSASTTRKPSTKLVSTKLNRQSSSTLSSV